tara:strand:- start:937 stop:1863 length:927 start_codon:yes stop_codon:yes gene_type:complete
MSLKEEVKAQIEGLPTIDALNNPTSEVPKAEVSVKPVEIDDLDNNDVDDEVDELPDLEDLEDLELEDDGGEDKEEKEEQVASTVDDDKRYTKQQVQRKIEKRISKEKRRRERLEREVEELRSAQLQANHQQLQQEPTPTYEESENISPQEYARRAVDEVISTQNQKLAQESQVKDAKRVYDAMIEKGSKKYSDFESTVNDGRYSQTMVAAARLQPNAEDVLYYLGKKEDVSYDIANLDAETQAAKVTKIAHQLATRNSKKRISKAPAPLQQPKASNAGYEKAGYLEMLSDPNMSLKELAKRRLPKHAQ